MKYSTIGEVAELLKPSRDTIYHLARNGELPTRKVGRSWRIFGRAISHSVIVDKHGGTLRVESEVGKGSTFIIGLPSAPIETRQGANDHAIR